MSVCTGKTCLVVFLGLTKSPLEEVQELDPVKLGGCFSKSSDIVREFCIAFCPVPLFRGEVLSLILLSNQTAIIKYCIIPEYNVKLYFLYCHSY